MQKTCFYLDLGQVPLGLKSASSEIRQLEWGAPALPHTSCVSQAGLFNLCSQNLPGRGVGEENEILCIKKCLARLGTQRTFSNSELLHS